jgi:hypothetical protein
MNDPEFRVEAASMNFEVGPVYGEDIQRSVSEILSTPKEVATRATILRVLLLKISTVAD